MRRKFKRLTAFLLSAAMVFPFFGEYPSGTFDIDWGFDWSVSAAEIVGSGNCGAAGNESSVTWSLDSDGTLTISGTGAMADYELVEDEYYSIYYTTPWHDTDNDGRYQNSNIKKVVVEEGVTHIGNSAFKDFTELTSISIPNTVKSIGNGSVSYCEELTSLVIPDSVTSIGEEAFYQNIMLTSVTIGNSVKSIGYYAFYRVGCNAGTNFTITLPKSVTSIDSRAFSNIYRGATIRYSCSYNEGNGYSAEYTNATLKQYHLCEYSSSGNEINCSGCTCGEYSSSTATLSLSSDEPIYYTGEEIKPAVTITYPDGWGGDKIEPNESNCTYLGNINAGTATCTFKYAEGVEASLDFTITECPHWGVDSDGMCDNCDYLDEPERVDEYYQIANAGNLMWFAQQVNEGRTTINAKLTADIDMNGIDWTIMSSFAGTFDGNGYTISGLNGHIDMWAQVQCHGFIRTLNNGGFVKNLTFTGAKVFNHEGSGAISAIIVYTNQGTVENCAVKDSNIHHGDYDALGVVVGVNGGTIRNCASISNTMTRRFSSAKAICGFVWTNSGSIENCFNYDCTYQNGSNRYAFTQSNTGTITNCYYYESSETISDTVVDAKTADQFAGGEVAYLLQSGQTADTETSEIPHVWGQTLTGENAQACPVLGGAKVYYGYTACNSTEKSYSNSEIGNEKPQHIFEEDSNGFCTVCGAYEQPETDEKGVYQISNAGELYWFAEYVNAGNTSANAKLTDNIVVNSDENISSYNGTDSVSWRQWTPIGNYLNKYTGTFEGNNKTISGLYFNDTTVEYVGLFGYIGSNAKIKNVGVVNSYFKGKGYVGGVCGYIGNSTIITNCYNKGSVSGGDSVGGVCGYNYKGTITNCYNKGSVSGGNYVGGVCGRNQSNGTITNCYNTGTVTATGEEAYVGGVCSYNYISTITRCYYDNTVYTGNAVSKNAGGTVGADVLGKSTAEFNSGEVAYLLNGSSSENVTWYQTLKTDTYPVLDSKHGTVYSIFACDGTTPAGYSNENKNEPHIDENGDDYCDNCGVIYNGIGAHLAGYSVSLNGSIGVNFHMDLTQDVLEDNEAYMLFTLPNGTTQKVMVSDAKAKEPALIEGKTYYIFTCNVAAKEMTDTIQAQLITSDGSKTQVYKYSVREYADTILSGNYDDETIELVKAMLHYGAYSQEWFNYNTTNLANAELDILDLSDADNWDLFEPSITNDEKVGSFTSAYLTLESDTAINLKFKLADGVSFEDLRVVVKDTMMNVVPATIVTTENVCLITLTGIKASDLDTMYFFSVTYGEDNESSILYSAMSYARAVADSKMDQKLKDLTAALRIFNLKADDKFEC